MVLKHHVGNKGRHCLSHPPKYPPTRVARVQLSLVTPNFGTGYFFGSRVSEEGGQVSSFTLPGECVLPRWQRSTWPGGHGEGVVKIQTLPLTCTPNPSHCCTQPRERQGLVCPRALDPAFVRGWEDRDLGAGCLETCWHSEPALQCAGTEDKVWESQQLAQSHVGKPGLKPAANPIQDTGPFRLAQCSISELLLNLIRNSTKVCGTWDTGRTHLPFDMPSD